MKFLNLIRGAPAPPPAPEEEDPEQLILSLQIKIRQEEGNAKKWKSEARQLTKSGDAAGAKARLKRSMDAQTRARNMEQQLHALESQSLIRQQTATSVAVAKALKHGNAEMKQVLGSDNGSDLVAEIQETADETADLHADADAINKAITDGFQPANGDDIDAEIESQLAEWGDADALQQMEQAPQAPVPSIRRPVAVMAPAPAKRSYAKKSVAQ